MTTIDQIIAEKLGSWYIGEWPIGNFFLCLIALVLSVLLCGAVGLEREWRGRSAGLRTHLLVGVGSCMIMIISIYGFPQVFAVRDVARLAAQVITGVGFLGAGAIIHRNGGIRGLTTAATIWIVMAIGLACGSMNFLLAIAGTVLILGVLTIFRKWESRMNRKSPLIMLRAKQNIPLMSSLLDIARKTDCRIHDLRMAITEAGELEVTFLALANSPEFQVTLLVANIEELEGILQVNVINGHKEN